MRAVVATLLACALASCATVAAPAPAPGVVAALQTRARAAGFDGVMLLGEANGSHRIIPIGTDPVAPDAVWRWASITKQLAAVLVMQEVERGSIDLDAPVARYWPQWRSPGADRIRIRDLLKHASGLPQPDESAPDKNGVPAFYGEGADPPAESANAFCAGPLRAQPPAEFNYNNCDTIVLAEVLHQVTGMPFEILARERLARRVGMQRFGIFQIGTPGPAQVRPIGEDSQFEGKFDLGANGASAGAYGTIEDLWRFDRALLTGRLLSSLQREAMWHSERSSGFYAFQQWVYPASLAGCKEPVRVVERQGLVAGIEHRNFLMPETGRVLILFARKKPADYGDPWTGKGLAFDLLSTVACRP